LLSQAEVDEDCLELHLLLLPGFSLFIHSLDLYSFSWSLQLASGSSLWVRSSRPKWSPSFAPTLLDHQF
jgi:hypothetical protein